MASRRLIFDPTERSSDGKVTFRLDLSGTVDEGQLQGELMPIFYRIHPALEDGTGRLRQEQGIRSLLPLGPEFFLTGPDQHGVSHLGGIRVPASAEDQFVFEVQDIGWEVEK